MDERFILDCLWQSSAALGVGIFLSFLWSNRPARAHRMLILGMAAAVLLPALSHWVRAQDWGLFQARQQISTLSGNGLPGSKPDQNQGHLKEESTPGYSGPVAQGPPTLRLENMLLVGWGILSCLVLIRLLRSILKGIRILSTSRPVTDPVIQQTLETVSAHLNLKTFPVAFRSEAISSPLIWCWRVHPSILLPVTWPNTDQPLDWTGVIRHELAHLKRRDHLATLFAEGVTCLLSWNPLVWWARRRLDLLGEEACDDWVLADKGSSAADYAGTLLEFVPHRVPVLTPGAVTRQSHLAARVQRILREVRPVPEIGKIWNRVCLSGFVAFLLLVACAQTRSTKIEGLLPEDREMDAKTALAMALKEARVISDFRNDEDRVAQGKQRLRQLASKLSLGDNLLQNSSFEAGQGALPSKWKLRNGNLLSDFRWGEGVGYKGSRGVQLVKSEGHFPLVGLVQSFDAPRENALLQLSAWIRTEKVGKAILDVLFLDGNEEWIHHIWIQPIGWTWGSGNHDWKRYTGYAYVPANTKKIEVALQMFSPGTIRVDDFECTLMKAR